MQCKKVILSKCLKRCGILNLLTSSKNLSVLCYHRIANDQSVIDSCSFDSDVYGCTLDTFRAHLSWLKDNTTPLNLDQLLMLLEGEDVGKGPYAMVTFDDAYRDCYDVAFEILSDMQIPAIVFVPSKLIDEGKLGWWDLLAYIFKSTELTEFIWESQTFNPSLNYQNVLKHFLQKMKLEPYQTNQHLIQQIADTCQVKLPSTEEQSAQMMTWEQIKEAAGDILDVGSHTHTHRVLTTISPEEQREELCLSKTLVENKIGKPVKALAYPVGGYQHFNETTQQAAQDCGYKVAFSFNTGSNLDVSKVNPFNICRFEPANDLDLFAGQCAIPKLLI